MGGSNIFTCSGTTYAGCFDTCAASTADARTTSSSAAVLATLLEPVTAAVVAAVLLGERLGAAGLIGMALVLLAVASLGRGASPRP